MSNSIMDISITKGFYSDLNWSCILYRESKEAKGEYDIVLK